jgi:hypothetical protein
MNKQPEIFTMTTPTITLSAAQARTVAATLEKLHAYAEYDTWEAKTLSADLNEALFILSEGYQPEPLTEAQREAQRAENSGHLLWHTEAADLLASNSN